MMLGTGGEPWWLKPGFRDGDEGIQQLKCWGGDTAKLQEGQIAAGLIRSLAFSTQWNSVYAACMEPAKIFPSMLYCWRSWPYETTWTKESRSLLGTSLEALCLPSVISFISFPLEYPHEA